jgi:hypothetical protein
VEIGTTTKRRLLPPQGGPIDPVLGAPIAVIRRKRWIAWAEVFVGCLCVVLGFQILVQLLLGHPYDGKQGPIIYLAGPIGLFILRDAWKGISRGNCLVIGELGFDNRQGDSPSGPVLWSDVSSMGWVKRRSLGSKDWVVWLKGGPWAEAPERPRQFTIEWRGLSGKRGLGPDLMRQAHVRWLNDPDRHNGVNQS